MLQQSISPAAMNMKTPASATAAVVPTEAASARAAAVMDCTKKGEAETQPSETAKAAQTLNEPCVGAGAAEVVDAAPAVASATEIATLETTCDAVVGDKAVEVESLPKVATLLAVPTAEKPIVDFASDAVRKVAETMAEDQSAAQDAEESNKDASERQRDQDRLQEKTMSISTDGECEDASCDDDKIQETSTSNKAVQHSKRERDEVALSASTGDVDDKAQTECQDGADVVSTESTRSPPSADADSACSPPEMLAASGWDSDGEEQGEQKKSATTAAPSSGSAAANEGIVASGWDSDDEVQREQKENSTNAVRSSGSAEANEGIVASGWDSDDEEQGEQKTETTTAVRSSGSAEANKDLVASGWDSDDEEKQEVTEAEDKREEPGEPSGWDSDEEAAPHQEKALESPESGVMAMSVATTGSQVGSVAAPACREALVPCGWDSDGDDVSKRPAQVEAWALPTDDAGTDRTASKATDGGNEVLSDLLCDVLTNRNAAAATPLFRGSSGHAFVPNLHCVGCDNQVMRIDNYSWSGATAYMFLRNNYPNVIRLRKNLVARSGSDAFCCQCSWRTVARGTELAAIADDETVRWKVIDA
eukprot:TRINITY_DN1401_c0_g1_i5.p1 TRINITY_DN1401_c0_g1~~TRINITY_DN1401_c0_g1_i5.p1  ORF type:complete len:593 (+),score=149.23 TRINITY_DN1401_c0_g1_i5:1061-2839(+)